MLRHRLLGVLALTCVLLSAWFTPPPVSAGNLFPFFKGNPHRYAEYNNAYGPWYGYGFGVPTYQWGYFGARYRPAVISHKGYYGDSLQWSYRHGY